MIVIGIQSSCYFVYGVYDWEILRCKYRITGELLGNNFCIPSLPMKLLPEEALLLITKGVAKLVKYSTINSPDIDKELFNQRIQNLLEQQKDVYERNRKDQINCIAEKILCGKRKKGDMRSKEEIIMTELSKSFELDRDTMLWPIYSHQQNEEEIAELSEVINKIPFSKFTIYKNLWEKGYYITPGNKFGGDYLLYLGDPVLHHSVNIVHCVSDVTQNYYPSELVAISRLGTSVKKRTLLAALTDDGSVSYITLNWIDT